MSREEVSERPRRGLHEYSSDDDEEEFGTPPASPPNPSPRNYLPNSGPIPAPRSMNDEQRSPVSGTLSRNAGYPKEGIEEYRSDREGDMTHHQEKNFSYGENLQQRKRVGSDDEDDNADHFQGNRSNLLRNKNPSQQNDSEGESENEGETHPYTKNYKSSLPYEHGLSGSDSEKEYEKKTRMNASRKYQDSDSDSGIHSREGNDKRNESRHVHHSKIEKTRDTSNHSSDDNDSDNSSHRRKNTSQQGDNYEAFTPRRKGPPQHKDDSENYTSRRKVPSQQDGDSEANILSRMVSPQHEDDSDAYTPIRKGPTHDVSEPYNPRSKGPPQHEDDSEAYAPRRKGLPQHEDKSETFIPRRNGPPQHKDDTEDYTPRRKVSPQQDDDSDAYNSRRMVPPQHEDDSEEYTPRRKGPPHHDMTEPHTPRSQGPPQHRSDSEAYTPRRKGPPQHEADSEDYASRVKVPPQQDDDSDAYNPRRKGARQQNDDSENYTPRRKGPPHDDSESYNLRSKGPPQHEEDSQAYTPIRKVPPQQNNDFEEYTLRRKGRPQHKDDSEDYASRVKVPPQQDDDSDAYNPIRKGPRQQNDDSEDYTPRRKGRPQHRDDSEDYAPRRKCPSQQDEDSEDYAHRRKVTPQHDDDADAYNPRRMVPQQHEDDSEVYTPRRKGPPNDDSESYNLRSKGPPQHENDSHAYTPIRKVPPQQNDDSEEYTPRRKGRPQHRDDSEDYAPRVKVPPQQDDDSDAYNPIRKGPRQQNDDSEDYTPRRKGHPQHRDDSEDYAPRRKGPSQQDEDSEDYAHRRKVTPPPRPDDESYNNASRRKAPQQLYSDEDEHDPPRLSHPQGKGDDQRRGNPGDQGCGDKGKKTYEEDSPRKFKRMSLRDAQYRDPNREQMSSPDYPTDERAPHQHGKYRDNYSEEDYSRRLGKPIRKYSASNDDNYYRDDHSGRDASALYERRPKLSAVNLVNILLRKPKFEASVLNLMKNCGLEPKQIRKVVSRNSNVFEEVNEIVSLRPKVNICTGHLSQGCQDRHNCSDLHICPKYVRASCRDDRCILGHNLKSKHNISVMETFSLNEIPPPQILEILSSSLLETKPPHQLKVCHFYNNGKCHNRFCDYLHICSSILTTNDSRCPNKQTCQLDHYILTKGNSRVLESYGIDTNESPRDVLKILSEKYPSLFREQRSNASSERRNTGQMGRYQDGNGNDARSSKNNFSSFRSTSPNPGSRHNVPGLETKHNTSASNANINSQRRYDSRETGTVCASHYKGNTEISEICFHSVTSRCRYEDSGCQRLHAKQHFHWQVKEKGKGWVNMRKSQVEALEKAYCDPAQDSVTIPRLDSNHSPWEIINLFGQDSWLAHFTAMILKNSKTNVALDLRRLCSENVDGSVQAADNNWYFLDQNNTWVPYGKTDTTNRDFLKSSITSDDIEKHFLQKASIPLIFQNSMFKYVLDFKSMTQTNTSTNVSRKVKRRPVPHMKQKGGWFNGLFSRP